MAYEITIVVRTSLSTSDQAHEEMLDLVDFLEDGLRDDDAVSASWIEHVEDEDEES